MVCYLQLYVEFFLLSYIVLCIRNPYRMYIIFSLDKVSSRIYVLSVPHKFYFRLIIVLSFIKIFTIPSIKYRFYEWVSTFIDMFSIKCVQYFLFNYTFRCINVSHNTNKLFRSDIYACLCICVPNFANSIGSI